MKIHTQSMRMLSDQLTPVSAFLKIRDITEKPCLLESNDFQSYENSRSIIGFDPLIEISFENGRLIVNTLGRGESIVPGKDTNIPDLLDQIRTTIVNDGEDVEINGFLGHTNFEAVRHFDTVEMDTSLPHLHIPDLHYFFYRYLIVFDHYRDQMTLIENIPDGDKSGLLKIRKILRMGHFEEKRFSRSGKMVSNMTDTEYRDMVTKGKHHCKIGDVFQIVLSRQYQQPYKGDDFTVYRVLRSVNPSPYLYYFDLGDYQIFGSSPESQLSIKEGVAQVNPIAGTYRRTGNDHEDIKRAKELAEDPKEVAEHTMLVDLARNDLGRHSNHIHIKSLMEIEYFSHVIHLVSTVEGQLPSEYNPFQIYADTFPAGTLSGAPKIKAMELINKYEKTLRGPYGGGIGYFGLDGNITQAIVIRSFVSKNNILYSQAGAGIVISSDEESELQEVNNKLAALNIALEQAEQILS